MKRSVAAAADERVDAAGDVVVAVPTGSACWVVRLLLLRLFPIGGLVGDVGLALQVVHYSTDGFSAGVAVRPRVQDDVFGE